MNIIQRPSPNFYDLLEPAYISILHTTLGSFEGAIEHLTTKGNPSAHFVIGRLGQIAQLVSLDKGAWHAGAIYRPSQRAKAVCRKTAWGKLKNPNRYSWGFEYASGYDIDRDGVIESWEKLYTPTQIKAGVLLHMWCEDRKKITIDGAHTLTHQDITNYKPNLDVHRLMFLSELQKQRELRLRRAEEVVVSSAVALEFGKTYRLELKDGKVIFIKV